jgi:UDP:flavonoid glycosyltransferase YjiC (YdhE family)
MRVVVLAYGTRGDVQPYVALGVALQQAGHEVRLAAPAMFRVLVESHRIAFHALPGDPADLMRRVADRAGSSLIRFPAVVLQHALPLAVAMVASVREACRDADVIVHSLLLTVVGHQIAAERGVPDFSALIFLAFATTSEIAAQVCPRLHLGGALNRLSHVGFTQLFWQSNRIAYAFLRCRDRTLPPLGGWPFRGPNPTPILYGLSPHIIPRPADWGERVHLTGYWVLDADGYEPPAPLRTFLQAGPPPVLVSFGSLVTGEARHLTGAVLDALAQTGQRGLLVRGWGALADHDLPDSVLAVDSVPFEWLFPRVQALVHHGGVGTTATGFRAGVPAVVVPFTADQPFWGRQIHRLGVGPEPIPPGRLTAHQLALAIERMAGDAAMRGRAARLGARLRQEDGAACAVEILARYLGGSG